MFEDGRPVNSMAKLDGNTCIRTHTCPSARTRTQASTVRQTQGERDHDVVVERVPAVVLVRSIVLRL